ncbi:MAG: hypothetical protein KFH87_10470 [Bacteroidetes bacterium]|nr:hypothetical protein [Bacteroidota bacterium]
MALDIRNVYSDLRSEMKATATGAFIRNESDRGVVRMMGGDARDLLHRLSTASIAGLADGRNVETLLTNEKGRVIDALLVIGEPGGLLLLTSPGKAEEVRNWMEKYTIMEDCTYDDQSAQYVQFTIDNVSSGDSDSLSGMQLPDSGSGTRQQLHGVDVTIHRYESVGGGGARVLCAVEDATQFWASCMAGHGLPVVGRHAYTLWRIERLLPAVGHELGERSNPLEAGADAAIDFRKGCFIGQEVIARLDSYDKVQRHPCRLRFTADATSIGVGAELFHEKTNAGFVTTIAFDPHADCSVGIGLVRNAYEDAGTILTCEGLTVEILSSRRYKRDNDM